MSLNAEINNNPNECFIINILGMDKWTMGRLLCKIRFICENTNAVNFLIEPFFIFERLKTKSPKPFITGFMI